MLYLSYKIDMIVCCRSRLSCIDNLPSGVPSVATAEYIGRFPDISAHGNCKKHQKDYIRTKPEIIEAIKCDVANRPPSHVYNEQMNKSVDSDLPRSLKRFQNAKYQLKIPPEATL